MTRGRNLLIGLGVLLVAVAVAALWADLRAEGGTASGRSTKIVRSQTDEPHLANNSSGSHTARVAKTRRPPSPMRRLVEAAHGDGEIHEAEVIRTRLIAELDASGSSREQWTVDAEQVLSQRLDRLVGVEAVSDVQCRIDGCYQQIAYRDQATYGNTEEQIVQLDWDVPWQGPQIRTGPELRADGSVQSYWIAIRPHHDREKH